MNINMLPLSRALNVSQNKQINSNNIHFKGLENDEFVRTRKADNLSEEEIKAKIKDLTKQLEECKNGVTYKYLFERNKQYVLSPTNQKSFDSLEKHIRELEDELTFYNAILYNPKLSVLADKSVSEAEKRKFLSEHQEVQRIDDIVENVRKEIKSSIINKEKTYKGNIIRTNSPVLKKVFGAVPRLYSCGNNNAWGITQYYADTSLPTYQENIDIIKENANNLVMTKKNYASKLEVDKNVITRYMSDFETIQLKSANTGKYFDTYWINTESENNVKLEKYLYELTDKMKTKKLSGEISAANLIKLGYITDKETYKQQRKEGKIKYTIKTITKDDGTTVKVSYADLDDKTTVKTLTENKKNNPRVAYLSNIAKEYGISKKTLDEAIIAGDIELQKYSISDYEEPAVDMRNEKNLLYFSKFQMPTKIDKSYTSLRFKIAWQLAEYAHGRYLKMTNSEIVELLKKEEEYNKYKQKLEEIEIQIESIEEKEDSTVELEKLLETKEELTKKIMELSENESDEIKIKSFFKSFWSDENARKDFSDANIKAMEILSTYKKNGIESVEDETIRHLILNYEKKN